MKLYFHYCRFGFSNCYVLGTDGPDNEDAVDQGAAGEAAPKEAAPGEAIIVDPGAMDEKILKTIENNNYKLRGVLITHDHLNHVHGLRTLERIYQVNVYAVNSIIREHKTKRVRDGDVITVGPFKIGVISVPGHSSDSAVYRIDRLLFTGDTMNAGLVGHTASTYGAAVQMTALRSKILSLPGDYTVLPGHGPPSTLETERRYNAGIQFYDENRIRRPVFKVDI
jgi:glyoxylase-like metal-dependent hydrolase (beta-lactamase superfamily II)